MLDDNWDKFDVFVFIAPTAFGKTAVAKTIMNAKRSVSVITPTNLLVSQFKSEFPETASLDRLDSYRCDEWQRPCSVTRGKCLQFCKGCKAGSDLATAKYRKGPGIYNYHTYLAHKLYRQVLVVDEAHNLLPTIQDRQGLVIWDHDYKIPSNLYSHNQIREWLNSQPERVQKHKKMVILKEAITYDVPRYIVQRTYETFNGKGTLRGEPELRPCLKLLPVDVSEAPPMFWPREIDKIILLSATIGNKDIEQLGLGRRRVCYIDCKSPIPAGSRPIIPVNLLSVNRNNLEASAVQIAEYIQHLAEKHQGEKGVIHVSYQLASILAGYLTDKRYLFHDKFNKRDQYEYFRKSNHTEGRILVACGMYEGIDLPQDLGRWQVIAKIPWMSLGNPAIRHMSELDPEWYIWQTIKTTIQACGRICRTPEDFGVTYILDKSFWRMYYDGEHLIPQWFKDAIQYNKKEN